MESIGLLSDNREGVLLKGVEIHCFPCLGLRQPGSNCW